VSDEISRFMPAGKDYVSVNSEGKKVHLQKRLILYNLEQGFPTFFVWQPTNLTWLDMASHQFITTRILDLAATVDKPVSQR
jgi:hypothetical protein